MRWNLFCLRALALTALAFVAIQGQAAPANSGSTKNCPTCQVEQNKILVAPSDGKSGTVNPAKNPTTPKPTPTPTPDPNKSPKKDQTPATASPQQPPSQTTPPGPSEDERSFEDWLKGPERKGSTRGTGNCNCKGLPLTAVPIIQEYYRQHRKCITGSEEDRANYQMAINDYSNTTGCMYIINLKGECKYALNADYGIGSNRGGTPMANCGSGSLGTPSGFHVTGPHHGGSGRYDTTNSMEMVDLQGQNSRGRGVLIHDGHGDGGAATWGCTGVSKSAADMKPEDAKKTGFEIAREQLPYGSLVFNYFPIDKQCYGHDVKQEMGRCERPPGAPAPSAGGNSGVGGAVR